MTTPRPRGRNGYDLVDAGCVLDIFHDSHISEGHSKARRNKQAYWHHRTNEFPQGPHIAPATNVHKDTEGESNGDKNNTCDTAQTANTRKYTGDKSNGDKNNKCHSSSVKTPTGSSSVGDHAPATAASGLPRPVCPESIAEVLFSRLPSVAASLLGAKR